MDAMPRTAEGLRTEVEQADGVGRIALTGQLDRTSETALMAAYGQATASDTWQVDIDFTGVDYINSTGIALVVRVLAEARKDGRTVRALGLTEHYRQIFTITRLSDFMTIVDEEAQP